MTSHVYILTDGLNTKIGITTDLNKRISSYTTHNPNFQIYKHYSCDDVEAKRVESTIKQIFKDKLSGQSREWFEAKAEHIDRYVSLLIQADVEEHLTPAMHRVKLPDEAYDLKEKIIEALKKKGEGSADLVRASKEKLAELFAERFGLGIPEHKLPDNVVVTDGLPVDLKHCDIESKEVKKSIARNSMQLPCDGHVRTFYHLIQLNSGYFIALCTARVSMPYLEAIEGQIGEIVNAANKLGWYATFHEDWSWHYPDKTALILYQQKTPVLARIRLWGNSFRKWVIERSKVLKHEKVADLDKLEMAIEDIECDNTFPLDVGSYKEFYEKYIKVFWLSYGEEEFYFKDAYEFLFRKWSGKVE